MLPIPIKKLLKLWHQTISYRGFFRILFARGGSEIALALPVKNVSSALLKYQQLCDQLGEDFFLLIYFDGKDDAICRSLLIYETYRKKTVVVKGGVQRGLVHSWNGALQICNYFIKPVYFGWASDHDSYLGSYYKRLSDLKNFYPEAVVIYCTDRPEGQYFKNIDINLTDRAPLSKTKVDNVRLFTNLQLTESSHLYGKAIYGLFRLRGNKRVGKGLGESLFPDRIFIDGILFTGGLGVIEFDSTAGILFDDESEKRTRDIEETIAHQCEKLAFDLGNFDLVRSSLNSILDILASKECSLSDKQKITYIDQMSKKILKTRLLL